MFYVKYISFVCFLVGRYVVAASSNLKMTVVMETDANYTIPTAVAMHSMERHSTHPLTFLVFVTDDVVENQTLCSLLSNVKREMDLVYLIKMIPILESIGARANRLSNDFI